MATSIRDNLELMLAGYEEDRRTEAFGDKHELWSVFDALKQNFSESTSMRSHQTVRVVWSAGNVGYITIPRSTTRSDYSSFPTPR